MSSCCHSVLSLRVTVAKKQRSKFSEIAKGLILIYHDWKKQTRLEMTLTDFDKVIDLITILKKGFLYKYMQ